MSIKKNTHAILLFVVLCVLYFSWLPDPNLKSETYIPTFILNWCNEYYNLRTAIPFLMLGFLFEFVSLLKKRKRSEKIKFLFIHTFFSAFLVCIAELGQLFFIHRSPDIMDVLFGITGSILGACIFYLIIFIKNNKNGIYNND